MRSLTAILQQQVNGIASSAFLRWSGLGAMLAGVLLATWGYIHDEDMSWRFGIIEDVLDFVVPLLFLVGMTGLYALGKGWVGRLGGAGFILGGVGTAWGFLDGVFDVPLWYFFWHTYFPRQGWLLGAVNWVSFLSGGLVLVGLALIWTRALRRWGDLVFGMGVVGLVYAFTETGDATATRLVHVAFGVVFSLGWVTFGYALFRSVGNRQSDISHVGRSFNLSGRFYWPSRFPKLLNRPIVLLISVVLLLTISGSLLYDRYESSLQHDSNTTAIQPDTPEVDTAQNEEAATFPEQEPATTKGTPSEAINAYPAEAPSVMRQSTPMVWSVAIEDFYYEPANAAIQPGDTIIWVNEGNQPHTVTSVEGQFDSEVLNPGDSFMLTFPEAGTFSYYCEIHPSMTGSVIVGAGGGEAAPMEQPAAPAGGDMGMGGY